MMFRIFLEKRLNEQEADNLPPGWLLLSCPPKPSGNMPAVRGPPHITGGMRSMPSLANYNSNIGRDCERQLLRGEPRRGFDLHGNVWEWCGDLDSPYEVDNTDPMGSTSGINRVKEVDHGYQSLFPYDLQCVRFGSYPAAEVQLMDSVFLTVKLQILQPASILSYH